MNAQTLRVCSAYRSLRRCDQKHDAQSYDPSISPKFEHRPHSGARKCQ